MIRVMVVEDELPLLRGIKNMIEHQQPEFQVVKAARNGREALDFLERETVDVIFTDINMPLMDGIELLQKVRTVLPAVMTVVISGYDDFYYAKEALRYQAKDYLLKPVDKGELNRVLLRVAEEYKKRCREKKNKALTDAVYGNLKGSGENTLFETVYPICFCAGAFMVNYMEEAAPGNEYWHNNDLKSAAAEVLGQEEGVFCFGGKNLNEMILLLEGGSPLEPEWLAAQLLERLPASLPVKAACGEAVNDIGKVQSALGSLRARIQLQGIFGETGLVAAALERPPFLLSASAEGALLHAAKKGFYAEFQGIVLNIRDQMKLARVTQRDLEQILKRIFGILVQKEKGQEAGAGTDAAGLDTAELLAYAPGTDQVFEGFLLLCRDMFREEKARDSHELMKQVDEYIVSHIRQPVNTIMLADHFGLVPPYLSRLFKEYKGKSPSQYIQELRIESAKELLRQYPHMRSKDIAEALGYTNPLYFSKAFKKSVGVYPSEYRDAPDGETPEGKAAEKEMPEGKAAQEGASDESAAE